MSRDVVVYGTFITVSLLSFCGAGNVCFCSRCCWLNGYIRLSGYLGGQGATHKLWAVQAQAHTRLLNIVLEGLEKSPCLTEIDRDECDSKSRVGIRYITSTLLVFLALNPNCFNTFCVVNLGMKGTPPWLRSAVEWSFECSKEWGWFLIPWVVK